MMKFIDYGDETVALILAQPNWRIHPRVTCEIPFTDIETALSHRQSRRNFGRSSRYTFEYTPRFRGAAASTEFRIGLTRLKDEPVAIPLWTDSVYVTNAFNAGVTVLAKSAINPVRYGLEWIIISSDSLTYDIVTVSSVTSSTITLGGSGSALNWPAGTLIYPLMFGRFTERPKLKSIKPQTVQGGMKFIEDSPYARRLNVFTGALELVGAGIPALSTKKLWNMEPTYSELLDTTETDIIYESLGFLRQDQKYVYGQFNRRALEHNYVARSRAQIANIERFFLDRLGPVRTFCIPTFRADLVLTQDLPIPGFDHRITIQPSEYSDATRPAQPGDPFIALLEPPNLATGTTSIDCQRVDVVAAGTLTTDQAITQTHLASKTRVSHLHLSHFAESQIVWDYSRPGRASTRIRSIELPDEYFDPQADLPEDLFFYRITEQLAEPIVSRFTNYETAMTTTAVGPETWLPAPLEHGAITKSTRPGDTSTEITSWGGDFIGNPLGKLLPDTTNANLTIEILLGDAADLSMPLETLFVADVMDVQKRGVDWTSSCVWGGRAFKRSLLRHMVQKSDNNPMFSRPTGLNAADFKVAGRFSTVVGTEIVVGHLDVTGQAEDWFAGGGWLETGTGDQKEIRSILHSEDSSGDQLLTIERPFEYAAVDQDVDLYPGYNGTLAQWLEKFAAGDPTDFGGYPFVPDTNPEIKAMEAEQSTGGKKG